jgi:demethylmenaquinone methyltransferase/2-methoxy-6-polyprenyl-1,4-benzoquinol methylase
MTDRTTTPATFDPLRNERLRALLDHPVLFNLSQLVISGGQRATKRWAQAWVGARPGDRLLDLCCGTGDFAPLFTVGDDALARYFGVDLNAEYIAYAQERWGGQSGREFAAADATRLRLPEGSFDRAIFVNSLHHFPDELARGILGEAARVLRAGGRLVLIDMVGDDPRTAQRFFLDRDRGNYLRPLAAQVALVAECFDIERYDQFDTGFTPQTIIAARPRIVGGFEET